MGSFAQFQLCEALDFTRFLFVTRVRVVSVCVERPFDAISRSPHA